MPAEVRGRTCDVISMTLNIPLQHQQRDVAIGGPNTSQMKPHQATRFALRNKRLMTCRSYVTQTPPFGTEKSTGTTL